MLEKKIAWVDCQSGIAGDMLLGALMDLGFPKQRLRHLAKILGLGKVRIRVQRETRKGLAGLRVRISAPEPQKARNLKQILSIISRAQLPEWVKGKSQQAFKLIAQAEAKVHSVSKQEIHFHELGAVDTILDIVGVLLGFYELGISEVYFSRVRLGGGEVRCAHGILPVPAPATLELLGGAEVMGGEESEGELTTPTGAVLIKILAKGFGLMPEMRIKKIGYGVGARDLETRPNLLRIVLGSGLAGVEELMQLEATIDDMNPEYYEPMMKEIFKAGALELALIPAQLKKSRPGVILRILCSRSNRDQIIKEVFTHSTTTGLRFYSVNRVSLFREILSLRTAYGKVRVKKIELPGGGVRIHPEFEDLRRISERSRIPLPVLEKEVLKEWSKGKRSAKES